MSNVVNRATTIAAAALLATHAASPSAPPRQRPCQVPPPATWPTCT